MAFEWYSLSPLGDSFMMNDNIILDTYVKDIIHAQYKKLFKICEYGTCIGLTSKFE